MAGYERISVETGAVARMTLQRPEARNALNRQMLIEIREAARRLDADEQVGIVVIEGSGLAFSAGVDLIEAAAARAGGESAFRDFVDTGRAAVDAIAAMSPVTIAAVHGHCVGAGMVLAAACDLRVASGDAAFSLPETRLGFPVMWGGIPLLLRHMRPGATTDLVTTSRRVDAEEAYRLGFVNRLARDETAQQAAHSLAADLAGMPGAALAAAKRMIGKAMAGGLGPAEELDEALDILWASPPPHG